MRRAENNSAVPEHPLDPQAVASAEAQMLPPKDERVMSGLLEALCDATRVKIVQALSPDNTLAAGDLAQVIGRSRSATSQHLKVLREVGAVIGTRDGNIVRYALSPELSGQVIASAVAAFDGLRSATPGADRTA